MKNIVLIIVSFALISCASYKIKHFEQYKSTVTTVGSDVVAEKSYKKKSIVIFPMEDSGDYATKAKIGDVMSNLITKQIELYKYGKVEDRNLLKKMKDEITLHEMNGSDASLSIPVQADYAVMGKINFASFEKTSAISATAVAMKAASMALKIKDENPLSLPATNVKVDATIKIIELPNLKEAATINCIGSATRQVVPEAYKTMTDDPIALKRAIMRCVDKAMSTITEKIKPYGFIVEKKVNQDGNAIFRINIGSDAGVKMGQSITAKRKMDDGTDRDLGTKSLFISDIINPNDAWIIVKNDDENMRVKVGDIAYVNVVYDNMAQSKAFDMLGLDVDE